MENDIIELDSECNYSPSRLPRHSVVVITYNQEDLVRRTLDSILCQKEYVHEIIVSDDCSVDNTWEVIKSYSALHTRLIKPYRNTRNIGIIANTEETYSKVTGDIIWFIAGDDELCPGLFKRANNLVKNHSLNLVHDSFCLYFDFEIVNPSGRVTRVKNDNILKADPVSLKIRHLISNRTSGIGRVVFDQFRPVNNKIGIMADGLIDIQTQLFSNANYYDSFVGSIYYAAIGVSATSKREELIRSEILYLNELIDLRSWCESDKKWLRYLLANADFRYSGGFRKYLSSVFCFVQSFDSKYPLRFYLINFLRLLRLALQR